MMKRKYAIAVCNAMIGAVLALMALVPKVTANAIAEFVAPAQAPADRPAPRIWWTSTRRRKNSSMRSRESAPHIRRRSLTTGRIKRRRT
jgi:hypothetical protein